MVAPFRCLPPLRRAFLVPPPPEPATVTHHPQLRSSTAVAGTIHGIGGAAEVTGSSHRLDGVVISAADEVQGTGLVRVFGGRTVSGGAPSQAPRGIVATAL